MKSRKNGKKERVPKTEKIAIGIRGRLILWTVIPIALCLTLVGLFLLTQIRASVGDLKKTEISVQTETAAGQVDAYFAPFFTTAKVVGDIDSVNALLNQAQTNGASFRFEDSPLFKEVLAEMTDAANNQEAGLQSVWFGGVKNSQLVASDGSYSDASFVISDRPWFKQVEAAEPGEVILTGAYSDYTTGSLVVTAAVGVYKGNSMIGVIGMDIMLDTLMEDLSSLAIGSSGYLTIFDSDGNVLYHPNSELALTNVSEMGYSTDMYNALSARQAVSTMEYKVNGETHYGSVINSGKTGWQILGCMPAKEYNSDIYALQATTIIGFLICAIILALVAILISNRIVRPVKKLSVTVGKLAEGNLDVEVDTTTRDEIGLLAKDVSHLVERLKTYILYIQEVSSVLDEVGHGNLVFELQQDYVGEFASLKTALDGIQRNLSHTMYRIVDSAAQVDAGTEQIASAAQALAQGATEQASTVEELSATIHELSRHSVEESERAMKLSHGVSTLGEQLSKSNQQMQQLRTAMEEISTQSVQIEKIIKTIEDIAFQTNILALNAAVEAARAGAAGKGFAVVADEVRNLASKSSEAAKSITGLIRGSMEAVSKGSELANETANSVGKVSTDVVRVVEAVEQFSVRYQEQTNSLEQVSEGVGQISAVVQTNSATAEESAAASEELSAQARLVKDLTDQFTMDSRFHN